VPLIEAALARPIHGSANAEKTGDNAALQK